MGEPSLHTQRSVSRIKQQNVRIPETGYSTFACHKRVWHSARGIIYSRYLNVRQPASCASQALSSRLQRCVWHKRTPSSALNLAPWNNTGLTQILATYSSRHLATLFNHNATNPVFIRIPFGTLAGLPATVTAVFRDFPQTVLGTAGVTSPIVRRPSSNVYTLVLHLYWERKYLLWNPNYQYNFHKTPLGHRSTACGGSNAECTMKIEKDTEQIGGYLIHSLRIWLGGLSKSTKITSN